MVARNHQKVVRFSKEEEEQICRKAKELNMTPAAYLRVVGTKAQIEIKYIHRE